MPMEVKTDSTTKSADYANARRQDSILIAADCKTLLKKSKDLKLNGYLYRNVFRGMQDAIKANKETVTLQDVQLDRIAKYLGYQ